MSGIVEPWVAVPPLAVADSPSAHTAEGMVVAADRAVVDTTAAHTVVDMAATAGIVPFVHRLFVGQERLSLWGCHNPRRTLPLGYFVAHSWCKRQILPLP